jgi:hypothetical protein
MSPPVELRVPLPGLVWGAYPERREPPRVRWPWGWALQQMWVAMQVSGWAAATALPGGRFAGHRPLVFAMRA